jgi:hypothetical protein
MQDDNNVCKAGEKPRNRVGGFPGRKTTYYELAVLLVLSMLALPLVLE